MIANSSSGSASIRPVAATQPISGGNAPGRSADDDILRRPRLQPHRVDEHVEQDRRRQQRRRQPVGRKPHQQHREDAQPDPEMKRGLPLHPPGRQRPPGRPPHLRVQVRLIPLVERPAPAGAQSDAQDRGEAERQRRKAVARRAARTARRTPPGSSRAAWSARAGRASRPAVAAWLGRAPLVIIASLSINRSAAGSRIGGTEAGSTRSIRASSRLRPTGCLAPSCPRRATRTG